MDNCWRKAYSSFFTDHFDDSVTPATHLQDTFEVHQTYTNLLSTYFSKGDFDMNSPLNGSIQYFTASHSFHR